MASFNLQDDDDFPQLTNHQKPHLHRWTGGVWYQKQRLKEVNRFLETATPRLAEWFEHAPTEEGCAEFVRDLQMEQKSINCDLMSDAVKKQLYVGRFGYTPRDGDGLDCYRCIDDYFTGGRGKCHWCKVL